MNPKSLRDLRVLLLPNPHSHWSATGPRSKIQPTTLENTQRKTKRTQLLEPKTGQAGFWNRSNRLSRTKPLIGKGNRLGRFGKLVRPVLSKNHQMANETNPEQNHLKNLLTYTGESHSLKETCLSKILSTTHSSQIGQTGLWNRSGRFCLNISENSARGKNSTFT
jgi:hypothetical protein